MSIVALQFAAVYSLLPFIWQSFFNIGLVFIYNVFLVLSGGVGLLQLKQMQVEEPAFVVYLEYILFVAYPITGQFVMTSVSALFFGWWAAPFFCIMYGFLFVQVFIVPSQSSFMYDTAIHKTGQEKASHSDVIGPMEKTLLLFNLFSVPGSMFIIIHFMEFLNIITWVQLFCCGFFPVFLCTCLNIPDVINFLNFDPTTVHKVRYFSGIICLTLFSVLFWSNGLISGHGLPLIFGSTILGLLVGMSAKAPDRRKLHQVFLVSLTLFYVIMIWSFTHVSTLSSQMMFILLGLTILSVLCVASLWVSDNKLVFSTVLVLQSAGMVFCEFCLLNQSIYSVHYAMLTVAIIIYIMFRLFTVNMINWQAAWLCLSIHSSKLSLVIHSLAPQHALQQGFLWPGALAEHRPIVCVIFSLFILKLLVFYDEKSVNYKKGVQICAGIGIAILLAYDSLVLPVWILLTNQWPSGADVAASVLLLWGLLCLRVSLFHLSNNLDAKRLNIVVLCGGVFIELFQPYFNPNQVAFSLVHFIISLVFPVDFNIDAEVIALQWLLLGSFLTCLVLLVKLIRLEQSSVLSQASMSLLIGLPVGLKAASLFFPVHRPVFLFLSYGMASSLVVYLIISSWTHFGKHSYIQRGYTFVALLVCLLLSLFLELTMDKKTDSENVLPKKSVTTGYSGLLYYLALFLGLGLCLKRQNPKVKASLEDNKGKFSSVEVVLGSSSLANVSVVLSCALATLWSPGQYWELWISLCACILLLWRPEGLQWNVPGSLFASIFLVLFMYLGTISSALPTHLAILPIIGFCMEMIVLHCSLPSHIGLMYSLWKKDITLTLQQLAVFCGPVNVVLLVYCSTFCGRILGFVGILATYWIFYYVQCTE